MAQEEIIKEKETLIIQAARKRFAHFGFSKVTMDEIASDVEMGKASLYYYFPTKEELFRSVLVQEMDELKKNIEHILEEKVTASQKLHEYVEQRMKFFQILLNLGTLSVHSYFEPKSIFKELFIDFENVELQLIREIMDEGKKSNEFDKKLCKDADVLFLHIIQGLRCRILKRSNGREVDEESQINLMKEMNAATAIFINGIKKK
jgi:TetR/AcrR family transcriptional regulator